MVRVHADDLGLHPSIDRAIFRGFEAGGIAEASILATGPTFRTAARQARAVGLPLALHLAIVDTAPISPPSEVLSLVDARGRFPDYFSAVLRRYLGHRLPRSELWLEVRRQLEAFADAGLVGEDGMQVDGHQHLHLLPPVVDCLLDQAVALRITSFRQPVRSPRERREVSGRAFGFSVLEHLGRRAAAAARGRGVRPVPCWGGLYAGRLTLSLAREVLASLPPDADGQLICHPGDDNRSLAAFRAWGYDWEAELATSLGLAGVAGG
jgi:predicted glycoside hydrolase/deacetylase ChbG (UPF0249 family)